MRTIKFRGKTTDDAGSKPIGSWVCGYLVDANRIEDEWFGYEIDPETVGQFTGLTDKNGKEIYEGDIVSVVHPFKNRTHTGEVIMDEDGCWNIKDFYFTHFDYPSLAFSEGTEYMEVIGNIHYNPELLK